jgi:hypothetical protein
MFVSHNAFHDKGSARSLARDQRLFVKTSVQLIPATDASPGLGAFKTPNSPWVSFSFFSFRVGKTPKVIRESLEY